MSLCIFPENEFFFAKSRIPGLVSISLCRFDLEVLSDITVRLVSIARWKDIE